MRRRPYLRHLAGGLAGLAGGCAGLEGEPAGTTQATRSPSTPSSETPTPEETTLRERKSFAAESNWPQFQFDRANTGAHPSTTGPTDDVTERWQFEPEREASRPVVVDGTVYFGTLAEAVVALDERDGTEIWRSSVNGSVWASPAVADGTVYVCTRNNLLYAFAAETGEKQWQFDAGSRMKNRYQGGITVADGTVYVGSGFGELYALDAKTGTEQWQAAGGNTPAVAGESVYIAEDDGPGGGQVHAFESADGSERWQYTPRKPERDIRINGSPTVATDRVFFGIHADDPSTTHSAEGRIYALSANDGTKHWQIDTEYPVTGGAIEGETLFISTTSVSNVAEGKGAIWAVDAATGKKQWRVKIDGMVGDPAMVNGVLYTVSQSRAQKPHYALALDTADGNEKWRFEVNDYSVSSPSVVNGTVYVGGGSVFALW